MPKVLGTKVQIIPAGVQTSAAYDRMVKKTSLKTIFGHVGLIIESILDGKQKKLFAAGNARFT